MKQKHTKAKKARRSITPPHFSVYQMSVFARRIRNIYGADCREYSRRHPDLDMAVEGYKQRLAALPMHGVATR